MPDPRIISEDVEAGRSPSARMAKDIEAACDPVAGTPRAQAGGKYAGDGGEPVVTSADASTHAEPLPAKNLR